MKVPSQSGGKIGCPDPDRWLSVAAGMAESEECARLTEHAAGCETCAQRLRIAIQIMSSETTSHEAEQIRSLASAEQGWQRDMAMRLARESRRPRRMRRVPLMALAASVAGILIGGGIWMAVRRNQPPLEQLARAYAENRTIELRIPGADYAPLRVERGSSYPHSPDFLESEAEIERRLPSHANDSGWLHARGRAELLEWRFDDAIRDLRLAADLSGSSRSRNYAEILVDLGTAYYERARVQDRPIDFSASIDYLSQAIQADRTLSVAYFNRAMVLENKLDYLRARDDWKKYLTLDSSGRWANEARERLAELEKKIGAVLPNDKNRLAGFNEQGLEEAMGSAFQDGPKVDALAARMERENSDFWLRDALAAKNHREVEVLSRMVTSRASLKVSEIPADLAELSSLTVSQLPPPLRVWAAYEVLFRITHSPAISTEGPGLDQIEGVARSHRYWWFLGELELDRSSSQLSRGDWAKAMRAVGDAREIARHNRLPLLEMRAAAFLDSQSTHNGRYREAARLEHDELAQFWQRPYRWLTAEFFFAGMAWSEEALGRERAASLSAESAAQTAGMGGALETQAVNLARAAAFAEASEDGTRATTLLRESREIFDGLPHNPATDEYRAFAESEYASASGTGELFAVVEHGAQTSTSVIAKVTCLRGLAGMDSRAGRWMDAEKRLRDALAALGPLNYAAAPADRRRWRMEVNRVYRQLTALLLRENRVQDAFLLWQDFLRTDSVLLGSTPRRDSGPATRDGSSNAITFARLDGRYAIWRQNGAGLRFAWAAAPADEIDRLSRRFSALCGWELSQETDLRLAGMELTRAFGPLLNEAGDGGELIIQPDGELARIPWPALPVRGGAVLAERTTPVVWPLPLSDLPQVDRPVLLRALAVGANSIAPSQAELVRPLPSLDQEMAAVASAAGQALVLEGSNATVANIERNLRNATVLHFAGHAAGTADGVSLLVSPDSSGQDDGVWRPSPDSCGALKLAVFSACSTGKYEEVDTVAPQSMAHAFLLAGTPRVIAALWNVDSRATSAYMEELYSGLRSGVSASGACRRATLAIRKRRGWQHPYYWAAFTFFGS